MIIVSMNIHTIARISKNYVNKPLHTNHSLSWLRVNHVCFVFQIVQVNESWKILFKESVTIFK